MVYIRKDRRESPYRAPAQVNPDECPKCTLRNSFNELADRWGTFIECMSCGWTDNGTRNSELTDLLDTPFNRARFA